MIVTRFAPSPTGFLHLGHVYSLICSYEYSKNHNGKFILRIEDIDFTRCKNIYTEAIIKDINWLKIPFFRTKNQSMRRKQYSKALNSLKSKNLIYPCWLSRKEAKEALTAPHKENSKIGQFLLSEQEIKIREDIGITPAWRLNIRKCIEFLKQHEEKRYWHDINVGRLPIDIEQFGDLIIARKDISTSYHLSVTIDDNTDGISHIIRGNDLFNYSNIHRLLQILLDLNETKWMHHALINDHSGNRIAKRSSPELTVKNLRESGHTPCEVINLSKSMI